MSKVKTTIAFKNIHSLWAFAQRIHPLNVEINTATKILTCNCSEEDLKLLPQFEGIVIEEYKSRKTQQTRTN